MAATAKKENYSDALVAQIVEAYERMGNSGLEDIASAAGKTKRSVISKLVREGVYQADAKPAKVEKDDGPTKKELLSDLRATGALDSESVDGLTNATKGAIAAVLAIAQAQVQAA